MQVIAYYYNKDKVDDNNPSMPSLHEKLYIIFNIGHV